MNFRISYIRGGGGMSLEQITAFSSSQITAFYKKVEWIITVRYIKWSFIRDPSCLFFFQSFGRYSPRNILSVLSGYAIYYPSQNNDLLISFQAVLGEAFRIFRN